MTIEMLVAEELAYAFRRNEDADRFRGNYPQQWRANLQRDLIKAIQGATMTRKEVLKLLLQLTRDAFLAEYDPDDISGLNTKYYFDQEQFMRNIESELEKEKT